MNKNNEATEINKENAKTKVRVAISDKYTIQTQNSRHVKDYNYQEYKIVVNHYVPNNIMKLK